MVFANPVLRQLHRAPLRALAVLCLAALAGCHGKADDKPPTAPPAPVEVQPAARGEMLAVYSGTAPIEADGEAVVVAKVGGELRQLLVEEGAHVRKGQVLARLDGERLRLEAAQTKAQLSKLERDYKRNVELQQRGLVAVSAFENLRYEVDAARAAYDLTALQLSYTDIRAPLDGVVAERFVKAGNTLNPNDKVFRIADLSPLVAHVHVPESELRKLRNGQVASVQVDAAGGAFQSVIQRISPVVDSNTGTFKVTLELRDPSNKLKPGMFARIDIVHERRTDVVRIARSALLEDDGNQRVFVVQAGKAVSRAVTLGLTNGPLVEVLSGVNVGDPVVVVGQGTLKDGSPVRVVTSTPPTRSVPTVAGTTPAPAPAAH
jgi:membrane fusion protein (multidrug efflux system)